MFRNRTSSQKPNDELYTSFKASYSQLSAGGHGVPSHTGHSISDALDVAIQPRSIHEVDDMKDQDSTPRGTDPWRFTPSLLDPNSFAFASFANQPPGYYTPTPGGTNTLYHSQAGDLHTPGFGIGIATPLSQPTSEGSLPTGQTTSSQLQDFPLHTAMAPHHFQSSNQFGLQQAYMPPHYSQQQSVYDHVSGTSDNSPINHLSLDVDMQEHSPVLAFTNQHYEASMRPPAFHQPLENFRFHVTLNAPTAMIKHIDEIPVTYLNKGQAYSIAIVDTAPQTNASAFVKYRTYVRISFEDEQQRQRPASCWQLWKEGRGTNEAHHRGGKLQAVEFVDPSQAGGNDISGRPRVELESASFDGFCVTWSPSQNGASAECAVAVRFNFLSTDFSHSKGVKGIPVRLCAKTEIVSDPGRSPGEAVKPEICYGKVKLFRDHGAERKLSNDIAHVKKTIDKLKQQIAQAESGMKDFGKRKRSGSLAKATASSRPGKVPKHKRTWSMSSGNSPPSRAPAEEDLHLKLATLQDMFTSTRPASVLYLKGEDLDDPDLHPVQLSGDVQDLSKFESADATAAWERTSNAGATSSMVSPTPSSQSLHSGGRRSSAFQHSTAFQPPSRMSSGEWRSLPQTATADLQSSLIPTSNPSEVPMKVQRSHTDENSTLTGWIEALGVDQSYQPPPERIVKPIACFYVQPRVAGEVPEDNYYRAIYLMQRTLKDFVVALSSKCGIDPTKVVRTIRVVRSSGINARLDDESIDQMPEAQDMTAEFHPIQAQSPMKREWDAGPTDVQVDGDLSATENVASSGYELRLYY